jgi:endonuclease YncB( thermonuclease family)
MDRTRIRLHGIDAPERDQPYGDMATAALKYMVGRSVYYVETDTDRYGRMVASLYHSKEGMTSTRQWCVLGMLGGMSGMRLTASC